MKRSEVIQKLIDRDIENSMTDLSLLQDVFMDGCPGYAIKPNKELEELWFDAFDEKIEVEV